MRRNISFIGTVQKFLGHRGWTYVAVPKKYTLELKQRRRAWGMYPIIAHVKKTSWTIKLMIKKGGDFFVALKTSVRNKENIAVGDRVTISFKFE